MCLRLREVRILCTAVLVYHFTEHCSEACVIVCSYLVVDVVLTVILVTAALSWTADQSTVKDMTEPNLRPQESGNRCDCTFASISDGEETILFEAVEKPFELGIKPYTDRSLLYMRHREDEIRTGTYITIQAFQQGIGTGACGPATAPEFLYPVSKDYELKFLIKTRKTAEKESV